MASHYAVALVQHLRKRLGLKAPSATALLPSEITVEAIYVSEPEDDAVIVLLTSIERPDCLFGYRFPATDDGGAGAGELDAEEWGDVLITNLIETISAANAGLPQGCDPATITWIE